MNFLILFKRRRKEKTCCEYRFYSSFVWQFMQFFLFVKFSFPKAGGNASVRNRQEKKGEIMSLNKI